MESVLSHSSPEQLLSSRIADFSSGSKSEDCFAVEYSFQQYFLPSKAELHLLALFRLQRDGKGKVSIHAGVTEKVDEARLLLENRREELASLPLLLEFPLLNLSGPVILKPVSIPKPWGREIWYTGIEQRGQSAVTDGRFDTPLSWWLSVAGGLLAAGKQQSINLLKILDPLPEEIYGDLYFELHEEKREVYVVTHVDVDAWPEGKGAIRFGFDQQVRSSYANDGEFRAAYFKAVKDYEAIRRQIDGIFDEKRRQQKLALDTPVNVDQLKKWHAALPEDVRQKEKALRMAMNRFTDIKTLVVGDVIKVPCLTPHALQHGVRTVEFQTPVYERKILSFAQKVLTQQHWDTSDAIELMDIEPPEQEKLQLLERQPGYTAESVVVFDDFRVVRVTIAGHCAWSAPVTGEYALLMNIRGAVACDNLVLTEEQAVFLPAARDSMLMTNAGAGAAVLLFAEPRR